MKNKEFFFLEGPLSKWWYSQVVHTQDENNSGGFSGVFEMETKALTREFSGRTPAEQATFNLDKARKKTTTVLKYANHFREELLEHAYRHKEDSVHDF
jgi:hypothetical protein